MSSTNPTLFDAAVRASDPPTSIEAGESMVGEGLRAGQAEVLDALIRLGGTGIAWDITETIQLQRRTAQQGCTAKRLGELEELGRVRRTSSTLPGPTGRGQTVWELVR